MNLIPSDRFSTEVSSRWKEFTRLKTTKHFSPEDILGLLEFEPENCHSIGKESVVQQTAYCFTETSNSVVFAGNAKWLKMACENKNVSCIFTNQSSLDAMGSIPSKSTIVSEAADEQFHLLHNIGIQRTCFDQKLPSSPVIDKTASVDSTAVLRGPVFVDKNARIGPHCVITGPVYIGPDSRIEELVTIGSRGLFAKKVNGKLLEFNYYGGVIVGSNSHIHARANIAAAPHFQCFTSIGCDVSIGISSNIGHDCVIHNGSTVASTACVCGRGVVGENAWIGAGAIVADARIIEANARVRIGAVVVENVNEGNDVSGNFAIAHRKNLREFTKRK